MNPYHIEGPAQIAFSGGRTSGYMLAHILEACGGLPADCYVHFQNTGKERPETLDFIAECGERWGVPIHWLEFRGFIGEGRQHVDYEVVKRATASEAGEPFDALIDAMGFLPNPVQRLCTSYLKVRTGRQFMRNLGFTDFDAVLGIRADEPRRVARMMAPGRDNSAGDPVLPLARAGVTKADVINWWRRQPFDLALDPQSDLGNCDLCFLKARHKVTRAVMAEPERVVWWMNTEARMGATFRRDRAYADVEREANFYRKQIPLFPVIDEADAGLIDCYCGE